MKKIKIAYDYQIFLRQRMGGISRVFYEVNSRLEKVSGYSLQYPVRFSENYYFRNVLPISHLPLKGKGINYGLRLYNKILFILFLKKHRDCDIVHATYYSSYFFHFLPEKTKYILTVHDCIQELYSRKSIGNIRMCHLKRKAVHRADAIIVPSENTKRDVMRLFCIDENKIHIIHWGTEKPLIYRGEISLILPNKYVLYVGGRNGYKNFNRFVLAVKGICGSFKDIKAVCIGGGGFTKTEIKEIRKLGIYDNILQMEANDSELAYAYQNAICFVYPSLYEGFGIPILESYENCCPVVLSNASCFPEVAGDAALYFEPYDVDGMRNCIIQLIENADLREKMIVKGTERLKYFSWDNTAKEIAGLYLRMTTHNQMGCCDEQ